MGDMGAAFAEADEDYGDDFETENAGKKEDFSLQAAAKQVDVETRAEVEAVLQKDADRIKKEEGMLSQRANTMLGALGGALGNDDESDDDEDDGENSELDIALRLACYHGEYNKVRSLLEEGANCRARDLHGWTSLHWAAKNGNGDIVEILMDPVSTRNKLHLRKFINAADSITGWTALHVACINTKKDAVRSIVKSEHTNLQKVNFMKETAADCVPHNSKSRKSILRILGVDVDPKDTNNKENEGEGEGKEGESKSSQEEKN